MYAPPSHWSDACDEALFCFVTFVAVVVTFLQTSKFLTRVLSLWTQMSTSYLRVPAKGTVVICAKGATTASALSAAESAKHVKSGV